MVPIALTHLGKYAIFSKVELSEVSIEDYSALGRGEEWRLEDIRSGFPNIFIESTEKFLPHRVNFHLLGGISFKKGCYTGQEIIARIEYLGKNKYQMFHVLIISEENLAPGVKLFSSDNSVIADVVDAVKISGNEYEALLVLKNKNVGDLQISFLDLPYKM